MVEKLRELRKIPKRKLWELYDHEAEHVVPSLNHYNNEILRREQLTQTWWLVGLTAVSAITAVFSVISLFVK